MKNTRYKKPLGEVAYPPVTVNTPLTKSQGAAPTEVLKMVEVAQETTGPGTTPTSKPRYIVVRPDVQRTKFKRKISYGSLKGTEGGGILDLLLGERKPGEPTLTMQHSIDTKSIMFLSGGLGLAAIVAGVAINKLSN